MDDAALTHTGRSLGDIGSERVMAELWPLVEAWGAARVAAARAETEQLTAEVGRERRAWRRAIRLCAEAIKADFGDDAEALVLSLYQYDDPEDATSDLQIGLLRAENLSLKQRVEDLQQELDEWNPQPSGPRRGHDDS